MFLSIVCVAVLFFLNNNEETYVGSFKTLDGDTLLINGQKLRLIGIDAPEYSQKCKNSKGSWRCGRAATHKLRKIVKHSDDLRCVGDRIDKYARPLVTCFDGSFDVNAIMVRDGLAVAYGAYHAEEREARAKKLGIWQGKFLRPQNWRRIHYGNIMGYDIEELIGNIWTRLVSYF